MCNQVILWSQLRRSYPEIELLNARDHLELVAILRSEGIEINDTMLLRVDGHDYVGADALLKMRDYMPLDMIPNRGLRVALDFKRTLKFFYPALVALRKMLLFLLGKSQIK